MDLKIASYNCRGLRSAFFDIHKLCMHNDIILVQEAMRSNDDLKKMYTIQTNLPCERRMGTTISHDATNVKTPLSSPASCRTASLPCYSVFSMLV